MEKQAIASLKLYQTKKAELEAVRLRILEDISKTYDTGFVHYIPMEVGETIYLDEAKGWKSKLVERNNNRDVFDVHAKKGHWLSEHQHYQIETIDVLSGSLRWWTRDEETLLHTGNRVIIDKNLPHKGYSEEDLHIIVSFNPPLTKPRQ